MRLRGQLNPGEYVIVATRQHPGALLPGLTCLLLGIAAAAFASTARSSAILWWVGTIAAAAFFIGALRIGWRWLTTGYLITTHRLVVRRGLVTRTGDESLYLDSLGARGCSGVLAGVRFGLRGVPRSAPPSALRSRSRTLRRGAGFGLPRALPPARRLHLNLIVSPRQSRLVGQTLG